MDITEKRREIEAKIGLSFSIDGTKLAICSGEKHSSIYDLKAPYAEGETLSLGPDRELSLRGLSKVPPLLIRIRIRIRIGIKLRALAGASLLILNIFLTLTLHLNCTLTLTFPLTLTSRCDASRSHPTVRL